jgi:hypothetical protein
VARSPLLTDLDRALDGLDVVVFAAVGDVDVVIAQHLVGRLAGRDVALVADQRLALEASDRNALHAGERMLGRAGQHQVVLADRDDHDLRMLLRVGDDAEVDLLGDDVLVDLVRARVFDVNVHLGVVAQVLLHVRRQLVQPDAVHDRDAQMTADDRAAVLQLGLDVLVLVDDLAAGAVEDRPLRGGLGAAPAAFQELAAILRLECPKLLADGGLGDEVLGGGNGETARLDDVAEYLQGLDMHNSF